jgi:hypothetical protein
MCIPKCILDSFGIRVKYMQNIKIHVFSWNITGHLRYILRYIRIHKGYMYPTEYMQDTCRIHHNTSGYVSDRKPPPKRIGNPPAPGGSRARRTSRERHGQTRLAHGEKKDEGANHWAPATLNSRERDRHHARHCASNLPRRCRGAE